MRKLGGSMSPVPSGLRMDPERSILAADDVAEAIIMAAGGSGWLWVPSYVVIRMVLSSAHRWTCFRTGHPAAMVQR